MGDKIQNSIPLGTPPGTEFDFWREKWQQEIDERQRKIDLLKGITFGTIVLLSLSHFPLTLHVDWKYSELDKNKTFKCAVLVKSVHDTQLIGQPIAIDANVNMKVYRWSGITDIEIIQKESLPLLLGYKRLFPLFEKLLKGE